MTGIAIQHQVCTSRAIADVDHRASHEHIDNDGVARCHVLVAHVGRNLIVGGRHLLDVDDRGLGHLQRARELVEIQLPVVGERVLRDVLDDEP